MVVLCQKNAEVGPFSVELSSPPTLKLHVKVSGSSIPSLELEGRVWEDALGVIVRATQPVPSVMTRHRIPALTHTGKEMEGKAAEEKIMFL